MSGRASEYKKGKMTNEERKARLKQRCMDDVASKRAKLVRSLRNAPGSVSQVGGCGNTHHIFPDWWDVGDKARIAFCPYTAKIHILSALYNL